MDKIYAKVLLNKTKDDYNRIADKFSSTRGFLPNDIIVLKSYTNDSDRILDLGSGNGRLSELFSEMKIRYTGIDFSTELLKCARKKYPEKKFLLADALRLPILDKTYNIVYCLSVLHHIPSKEFRLKFLREAYRVLKPCGQLVLTVWNMQKIPLAKNLIMKNNFLRFLNISKLDYNDLFYPFKDQFGKIQAERYIHSFNENELKELFQFVGFKVVDIKYLKRGKKVENENILIVGRK
jgi:ubiquinone/menaquinone biosynthesis C-methylase UbiE